jgi:hypothetical protein
VPEQRDSFAFGRPGAEVSFVDPGPFVLDVGLEKIVTPSSGQRRRISAAASTNQAFQSSNGRGVSETSGREVRNEQPAKPGWSCSQAMASQW